MFTLVILLALLVVVVVISFVLLLANSYCMEQYASVRVFFGVQHIYSVIYTKYKNYVARSNGNKILM